MSYSASHGAPLILMWHAVSLHFKPPLPHFPSFFSSPKTFLFLALLHHREPCERRKTKEVEDEKEEEEERRKPFPGSDSKLGLFFCCFFFFYSRLSYPHQPAAGGGEVSVFSATFSKSSIDTVWCQLKVTKSLMLPDATAVAALLHQSMRGGGSAGGTASKWVAGVAGRLPSVHMFHKPPPLLYFIALS